MRKHLRILIPAVAVVIALSVAVFLKTRMDAPPAADRFLTQLCSVNAQDFASMDDPAADYPAYLTAHLGEYCAPEVLDELLTARFPFSLMEMGVSLEVQEVEVDPLDPETAGANRSSFRVQTLAKHADGRSESAAFTGRLRQDRQSGQIVELHLNVPDLKY